jgi:hypothetical protein
LGLVFAHVIENYRLDLRLTRVIVTLRLLTIVAAIIALITSLFFSVSSIAFLICIPLLAALYFINKDPLPLDDSPLRPILTWSLLIVVFYSIMLFAFGTHASRIKSSRYAISQIAPQLPKGEKKITFLSHNSYSFYYYPRAWGENHPLYIEPDFATVEEIAADLPLNLVINKTDKQRISAEVISLYKQRGEFGKWSWWQKVSR